MSFFIPRPCPHPRPGPPGWVLIVGLLAAACGGDATSGSGTRAGLVTAFDSTADTIFAVTDGAVAVRFLRTVNTTMRIAPAADDTTLFSDASQFVVDQSERIWLFDWQSHQLFLFDSTGQLVRRIGRQGQGPGEFSQGNGMVVLPDTGVAILDSQNGRVSFFDSAGNFRTSWPVTAGFMTSNGLVTDRSGALYLKRPIAPPRQDEVIGQMGLVRIEDGGTFADSIVPPVRSGQNDVYMAASPDGRTRSATGSRYRPQSYWVWGPDGWFVYTNGDSYEIVLARRGAPPIVIRRQTPSLPVPADDREQEKEFIIWQMRRVNPGWTWSGPDLPETQAPIAGLTITRDGNIWARVATPLETIPADELPAPRADGPPPRRYRRPVVYEVFAPDGRFLGRVPMPPRTSIVEADGNVAWGVTRDQDDLPAVVRLRIDPPLIPE